MILQKTVKVIVSTHYKYYEKLGYLIPKYINSRGKLSVKQNTRIEVDVKDLPSNSRAKVLIQCDVCGKKLTKSYQSVKKSGEWICKKCVEQTKEYKEKISKANTGKIFSEEHKRNISKSKIGKNTGKNNPFYNHSLTEKERMLQHDRRSLDGYSTWKSLVKFFDNYKCRKCGSTKHICCHHINNYSNFKDQRIDTNNGVTLCKNCHKQIHKMFGAKTTEKHYNDFMKLDLTKLHIQS
jgi:hypothetical protein